LILFEKKKQKTKMIVSFPLDSMRLEVVFFSALRSDMLSFSERGVFFCKFKMESAQLALSIFISQ